MRKSIRLLTPRLWWLLESLVAAVSLLAAFSVTGGAAVPNTWNALLHNQIVLPSLVCGILFFAVCSRLISSANLYDNSTGAVSELSRVAVEMSGATLLLFALLWIRAHISAGSVALDIGLFCFSLIILLWLGTAALVARAGRPSCTTRSILIIGTGPLARRAYRELRTEHYVHHRLIGFADVRQTCPVSGELASLYLGSVNNLEAILLEHVLDEVIIAMPVRSFYPEITAAIESCRKCGVEVRCVDDIFESDGALLELSNRVVISRPKLAWPDFRRFVKLCADLFGSSLLLILFAPVMLALAVAIKVSSKGPVFCVEERYGLCRRRFPMYKFRTMHSEPEARLTPLGSLLRRTSLDQLPQLFNVWMGQMSLVGPRPLSVRDVSAFSEAWLIRRFSVKPGLTCLWQVAGRSEGTFAKWMRLDLQYIDNWSLALDLKILAQTIPALMKGTGAL
jgi:exopolysaccharide biosynthesis polyprenyl glycosylphosphotransferase